MTWQRYTHHDMHQLLCDRSLSERWNDPDLGQCGAQALHCPYYVPLEGRLGADWGIIVNPESSRFGLLTFEHDDCGCPESETEDKEGWGRHADCPSQDGDMWDTEWRHVCEVGWCDTPCEEAEEWGTP
jgi:hypothetical protein